MYIKGKFCKTVVRPAIIYGLECWAVVRNIEQSTSLAEMIMLRFMSRMIRENKIRN